MTRPPFELTVSRQIAASPERVWTVITQRTAEWWCPKPWHAEVVELDWRAGGRNAITMHGPNGEVHAGEGLFLSVEPGRMFAFTDAMTADLMPQSPFMIGIISLKPNEQGTLYTASARHWTEEAMVQHRDMGFETGWSAVADQLACLAEAND